MSGYIRLGVTFEHRHDETSLCGIGLEFRCEGVRGNDFCNYPQIITVKVTAQGSKDADQELIPFWGECHLVALQFDVVRS